MWPPGWDSIEATGWYASLYFWLGIICLFALGVFEVISHYYGLRESDLIEAQRKQQDSDHQSIVSNLEKRLTKAREQLVVVQKFQAQRRLTEAQKAEIIAAISPFRGQRMTINSTFGDGEARVYRDDFAKVFEAAGWDHQGNSGIAETRYSIDPVGIEITIHQVNERQGLSNDGINALIQVIGKLDLFAGGGPRISAEVPAGEIDFRIGIKTQS